MEIDQNGQSHRNIDYEIKRKKSNKNKNLTMSFLELILTKKTDFLKLSIKYSGLSNKWLKKSE